MDQAATTDPTDTAVGDTNVVGAVKFGLAVGFNIKSSSQLTLDGNEQSTPVTPSAAETFTENASSNEPNFGQSHILQLSSFINTTPSARDVAKNASALLGLSNLFKNTALDLASVGHVIAKIIATVEISFLCEPREASRLKSVVESTVLTWFSQVFGLSELKHVHYHGSVDFSAGRLPQAEIQVFRTATFLCMGPNPERITSSAIPVFYIPSSLPSSAQHPETVIKKYWALIGAPSHAPNTAKIRRIPSVSPNSDAMDVATLIAFLSEDIAVGRRPCVVYARAASSLAQSVTGEWDDLTKIREICSRFGCWMHVECDNVAVLATPKDANSAQKIESLRTADSIAFTPSAAFQLVNQYDLPAVTLFNTVDPRLMDPLHLESFDSAASEKSSHFSLQSVQKRRTGGSAGGALIAAALRPSVGGMMERTSAEHSRESFSMSRSGSISSVNGNGNNNTGNNTGSNTPSTAPTPKLFKRISSCALFQNLLNQSGVEPVSLKFTLPWWVWSTGKYSERLIEAFEVGRDLTEKLYDDLENIPDLNVHLTANASNYLTLLTQFNPTIPSSETLLKHSEPSPAHLSHIPPPSGQQFISKHHHTLTTNSPWTPGYETPLKLMEETRREAWGNRMNADLGTRVLFNRIPTDLKNAFNLELVKFSDPTNESNRTFLTNKLVEFLAKLSRAINETLQHQKTLQSIVASLDGPPIELRYIPPMSLVAGDRHNKDHSDEIGLGGLHFTPTYLDAESNDLAVVTDLDALNVCLADEVARRRGGDGVVGKGVIVPGVDVDGVTGIGKVKCCLRIGLDENGYNPEKIRTIVNDVLATGRILERSDEFLATLSEVIKRGIHEAELDLKKENSGSGGGSNNNDEVMKHIIPDAIILHSLPVIGTVLGLIGVISPTNLDHHHNHHGENPESSVLLKDTTVRSNSSARFSEDTEGRVSQSFVGSPRRKMARSFTISSGFSTVPVDIDVEKSAAVAAAAAARKQALAEEAQRLKDQDIEDESGEEYIDDGEYDSNIYLEKGHEADNANVKQVDEDKEKEDLQMNTLEDVQEDSEAMEVSSKNNESIVSERVQEQHPTREDYNVPRIPLSMASLPLKQGKSPAPARKEYGYALTSSSGSNSRSSSADSKRSGSKLLGRAGSSSKLLSSKKDENSGGTATQIPSRGALQQPEAQLQTQTQAQEVPLRNNTTMQERLQAFQRLQSVLMAANQLAASEAAFSKQQAARTETHTAFDAALAKLFLPSALESCDGASAACDPGANGTRDVMSERDHDATATARDRLRAVAAAVASLSVSENTLNDSAARSREDAHTAFDRCLTNSLLSKDGASLPLLPVLDSATYSSNLTFAEAFKGANNLISNNESEKTIATASVDREDAFRRLETVMKAVNRLSSVEAALKGHVGGNDPDVRLRVEAHCEFGRVVESLLVPGGRVLQNDAPGGCSGKNILGASFGDVCAAAAAANIKN